MSHPENTFKNIIEKQDKKIEKLTKIIEMMIVKFDRIDNNMFPDPDNQTSNLNSKNDWARIEHQFTQKLMEEFNEVRKL